MRPAASYTRDPFVPTVEGDRLYGLGSNDAGASVVCLLETFLTFRTRPLPFNLVLGISAEEECMGENGIRALLPARGLGLLTGLAAIPALFYTYQGILGRGIMWVDVLVFQLAVLLAFWVSWSVQARRVLDGPVWQILGGVTLLAVWGLAIWWTYAPPQLPLFVDPTDGSRGIPLR